MTIAVFTILTALAVNFIWSTTQEGMIFGFVRKGLYFLPEWIKKPLYTCVICMSFWYGFAFWFLVYQSFSLVSIIAVFAAGGINFFFTKIFDYD